jgi:hypothetical protein
MTTVGNAEGAEKRRGRKGKFRLVSPAKAGVQGHKHQSRPPPWIPDQVRDDVKVYGSAALRPLRLLSVLRDKSSKVAKLTHSSSLLRAIIGLAIGAQQFDLGGEELKFFHRLID